MLKKLFIVLLFIGLNNLSKGQDLLAMLDSVDNSNEPVYASAVFKSVRLINGYTTLTAGKNELVFSISHRFGRINTGAYEFFGLDYSTIRLGFEYGITDRIDLGIGRSSNQKHYDGFVKINLLRQSSGIKNMPVSIVFLEQMVVKTEKWPDNSIDYPVTARYNYVHELLISRKFNEKLSLQLVPVIVHRNLVAKKVDQNIVPALGFGGMYKITNRFTLVSEYYTLFPGQTADDYQNSLAFGVEIETGGHVFQLNMSNALGMTEKIFIPETTGKWLKGDIHFGFNIIRVF